MDIVCQMVGEPIPADLCSAEQGTHHCVGCVALTRRCMACLQACGIADAARGLCAACAEKNPKRVRRDEVTKTVSSLLEGFNESVERILDTEVKPDTHALSRSAQTAAINPPILSQPDLIYGMLSEHALANADTYVVRGVMQLLAIRARLTEDESRIALRKLVGCGQIGLMADGEVRLLKDLDAVAKIIERRGEEYTARGNLSRAKKPRLKSATPVSPVSSMPSAPSLPQPITPQVSATPVSMPAPVALVTKGPSVGDIFRFVREMSSALGSERLARAVVPTISSRLKLPTQDVVNALTKLEDDGAIVRKDGWRVVAVLKENHDDTTPVVTPKAPALRSESMRERPHLRVVPNHGEVPQVPEAPPPMPAATSLDEAIERLEQTLPGLRTLRDQVNAKVAMLELSLAQLKSAKTQAEQADAMAKQTLAEAETAMNDLLSTLRHKA